MAVALSLKRHMIFRCIGYTPSTANKLIPSHFLNLSLGNFALAWLKKDWFNGFRILFKCVKGIVSGESDS